MDISFLTNLGIDEKVAKQIIKQHSVEVAEATQDIKGKYDTLPEQVNKGRLESLLEPYGHLNKTQREVLTGIIDVNSDTAKKDLDKKAKELGWAKPQEKLDVDADKSDSSLPTSTEVKGDKPQMTNAFGIPITAVHKL